MKQKCFARLDRTSLDSLKLPVLTCTMMAALSTSAWAAPSWVSASNGNIPNNAVVGGQEADGRQLFVCQASHQGGLHTGKIGRGLQGCHIAWGSQEIAVPQYQVLVNQGNAFWVAQSDGALPVNPVQGGQEADGEPMYVCRARHQGGVHTGKIRSEFEACYIGWGGKAVALSGYEVLALPRSNTSTDSGSRLPRAVIGLSGHFAFGDVSVGQSKTSTLTIQNSGSSTLTVSSITYPTGFSGAWSGSVAAGRSQAVTVTFKPTQAQPYSGSLIVDSNKNTGTSQLSVSGTGIAVASNPNPTSKVLTAGRAIAGWDANIPAGQKRPVVVFMPGWGGSGAVNAGQTALNQKMVKEGYVTLAVGFDALSQWNSNLSEKVVEGLNKLCADVTIPANCAAIVLNGTSYGGSQTDKVTRYARNQGYSSASKRIIGFVSQDAGYAAPGNLTDPNTGTFTRTGLADASQYAVAMIENLADYTFPIDACTWGNCGTRHLARAHQAAGHNNTYSLCPNNLRNNNPALDAHGARDAAGQWDAWVISATKKIIHSNAGVPTFSGYSAPSVNVSNACQ